LKKSSSGLIETLTLEGHNSTLLQTLLCRRSLPQADVGAAIKLGTVCAIPRKTRTNDLP